jgi:hypothetical protein
MVKFTFEEAPVGGGDEQGDKPPAFDEELPGIFLNYCTANVKNHKSCDNCHTWG